MAAGRDDGEGAARRRRERRLRSWLKHERQSVAMALSEYKHPSSRGQRKDRAGEEGHRDEYEAPRREKPPPPKGSRLPCLGEARGPQAQVQNHTMEQLADVVPMVQILDVPQMVEELLEVFRLLDTQMPVEQAVAVPKISLDRIPQRSADLVPQMVEQLVDVPTVLSLSSLQQTAEQIVDILVPRGRDRRRQGFLPGQSSTAAGVQNVDIPVRGGLRGFLPGQSSTQRAVEQLVDSSSGGLQDFHLGQGSTASSSGPADEAFTGGFRTFHRIKKKCGVRSQPESDRARQCQLMDAGGL